MEKIEYKVTVNELKDIVNKVNGQHKDSFVGLFTLPEGLSYKGFVQPKDTKVTVGYDDKTDNFYLATDSVTSGPFEGKDITYLIHSGKLTSSTKLYKDNKFFTAEFKFNSKEFVMNRNDVQVDGIVEFMILSVNHEQVRLFSEKDKFIFNMPLEDFINVVTQFGIFIPIKEKEVNMFGE